MGPPDCPLCPRQGTTASSGNAGAATLPAGMRMLHPTGIPGAGDHDQVRKRPQLGDARLPRGRTKPAPGRGILRLRIRTGAGGTPLRAGRPWGGTRGRDRQPVHQGLSPGVKVISFAEHLTVLYIL